MDYKSIHENDKNQICCKCNHCGNIGYLDIKGFFNQVYYVDDKEYSNYPCEERIYYLLECPVCNKPILVNEWKNLCGEGLDYSLCYPIDFHDYKFIPLEIKRSYEDSRDLFRKESYELCAVSLRILLEKIANNKNANGNTLEKKIEDLARANIIPTTIKDASNMIRKLGNKGAHGVGANLTKSQLEKLFLFIETIIDYIYEIPGQLKHMAK